MPEGDTIFRSARTMDAALRGRRVVAARGSARVRGDVAVARLVGETVRGVEPRGKHLLHWFAPAELALHTHLGMSGTWHLYRPGERWRKPPARATVVIEVEGAVAACFAAPVAELLTAAQVATHPGLAGLGPDALAGAAADLEEARRRLDARADWAVGEALLDQRVLAGVGNVYKCEVLFAHRLDPWTPVREVPDATRDAVLATAERLLRANVAPGATRRVTTGATTHRSGDRLHVYGKARRPCPRCGTPISAARQGSQARVTYWCPACQGPGPHRPAARASPRVAG